MLPKRIMDTVQLHQTIADLLRNKNVEFVQVYTCADYQQLDDPSEEGLFTGWYDWYHLKNRGVASPDYKGDVYHFIAESDRYEVSNIFILSLEFRMKGDKALRLIPLDQDMELRSWRNGWL